MATFVAIVYLYLVHNSDRVILDQLRDEGISIRDSRPANWTGSDHSISFEGNYTGKAARLIARLTGRVDVRIAGHLGAPLDDLDGVNSIVSLTVSRLQHKIPMSFQNGLPNCRELILEGNEISDDQLSFLARCPKLQHISLDGSGAGATAAKSLTGCQQLRTASFVCTLLDDDACKSIGRIAPLLNLNISGCNITDDGIMWLAQLRMVNVLNLNDTKVTGKGLRALAKCPNLEIIAAENVEVSAEELLALEDCRLLSDITISDASAIDPDALKTRFLVHKRWRPGIRSRPEF